VSHPGPLRLTNAQGNSTLTTRILNTMFSQACGCQTDKYWGLGSEPDTEFRSSPPYMRRIRLSAHIFFSPQTDYPNHTNADSVWTLKRAREVGGLRMCGAPALLSGRSGLYVHVCHYLA
jgi:hypothetical protein